MFYLIFVPFFAAMLAGAFCHKLTDANAPLGWWPPLANKYIKSAWALELAYRCERCIAGQFGLWTAVAVLIFRGAPTNAVFFVIWSIVAAMFLVGHVNKSYGKF